MTVQILIGDCRNLLATLPDESVHCVVTSPPYFGLRDYGIAGQIGLETSTDEYVAEMVAVFRQVRRVLRKDGTCWLNLGDSYASGEIGRHDGYNPTRANGSSSQKPFGNRQQNKPATGLPPKNLIGIPWRVAFALQAPDYLGRIRSETDRAWLAALIDGEGCISILETTSGREHGPVSTSYPPILQIRMCDPQCIERAMLLVGSESENPAQYPPSQGGVRPSYQWRIHGRKAADTIAEIYPWLLIKRKQAVVAWNHQTAREGYETKRGVKVPTEAVEKQRLCKELINRLNQKEAVDLPSWMIEPPQPIGPGWYLRQDLIWSKPNPMPESVRDRCTKAHEYIFLMSKNERYYYDADTIKSKSDRAGEIAGTGPRSLSSNSADGLGVKRSGNAVEGGFCVSPEMANKRSVWEVPTMAFPEAHFATFPPALIEPCILAGTSEKGCCARCGAPWVRVTKAGDLVSSGPNGLADKPRSVSRQILSSPLEDRPKDGWGDLPRRERTFIGWSLSCICDSPTVPCTVLDPFGGAGTTGLVADRQQRNAILIELNPEYAAMARRRIDGDAPLFANADLPGNTQAGRG